MSKKTIKALIANLLENELKFVEYRTFLALERGGVVCTCPDVQSPCNSSCTFFEIRKDKNALNNKVDYRVVLSCRPVKLYLAVEI